MTAKHYYVDLILRTEVAGVVFFIVLQRYKTKEMCSANSLSLSTKRSSDIKTYLIHLIPALPTKMEAPRTPTPPRTAPHF